MMKGRSYEGRKDDMINDFTVLEIVLVGRKADG